MNDTKDGGLDIDELLAATAETDASLEAQAAEAAAAASSASVSEAASKTSGDKAHSSEGTSKEAKSGKFAGVKAGIGGAWSDLRENYGMLLKGAFSPDAPTRRMTYLFYLCHVGVLLVAVFGFQRWSALRHEKAQLQLQQEQDKKEVGEILQKQAESALKQGKLLELGRFSIDMTSGWGAPRSTQQNFTSAEIDFVVDCDSKETCDFLEKNLQRVRDQVIQLVTSVDRDELLTREGKKRLRRAIQDKINSWLQEQGKLNDVYISRLVMG